MATDTVPKAQNLARKIMDASTQAIRALDALEKLEEERAGAAITFTDPVFVGSEDLRHMDPATITSILGSATTIRTYMRNQNHDDNFDKAIP